MPTVQDAARAAGVARLRQAAEKFASGDHSILRSSRLALGRTSLYLSAAPCQRWLPDNRLDWWDAQPWATGALLHGAPDGTIFAEGSISAFLCEFDPRLATIAGADLMDSALANQPELLLYTRVPWDVFSDDDLAQGIRPDVVSGIGFSTVDEPPKSHPYLARVPLRIGTQDGQPRTVLVNQSDPGALDPNAVRPDLVLRFDTPQRAVGIEFAFVKLSSAEPDPAAAGIVLVATDAAGNQIATSNATDLQTRQHFRNASPHLIGVRDSHGGIVQVALRYLTYEQGEADGPGAPIQAPQVIYRVWSEPLPFAAVKQVVVQSINHGGERGWEYGALTLPLPFRCDQAAAFLRGSRIELIVEFDGETGINAQDLHRAGCGIDQELTAQGLNLTFTDAPWRNSDRGEIVPPCQLRAYCTVVAWNSELVDLRADQDLERLGPLANSYDPGFGPNQQFLGTLSVNGSCPDDGTGRSVAERCGPAVGALTRWNFSFASNDDQDLLWASFLVMDATRGDTGGVTVQVRAGVQGGDWQPDEGTVVYAGGLLLSGRSLVVGADVDTFGLTYDPFYQGPRLDDGTYFLTTAEDSMGQPHDITSEVVADMGFLTLGFFILEPEGPVGQLDVELLATNYDGQAVTWELGGGISRRAFISGGLQPSNVGLVIGLPRAVGIVRRDRIGLPRARVQDAFYATYVGTVGIGPGQFGGIWNVGDAHMLIVAIDKTGPDADDFFILLTYRGEVLSLDDAQARLPLSLAPGEALLVGGNFYVTAVGTYHAALAIGANAANGTLFTVNLTGYGEVDNRPPPTGQIIGPDNFGGVGPDDWVDRNFLIACTSETPLIVRHMTIGAPFLMWDTFNEWPPPPHNWTYQIESGQSWEIRLTFHPQAAGNFHTVFTVDTNGGQLTMDLYGEAG